MKFTDGYWQMRPEVTAHFPVQVHEVEDSSGMPWSSMGRPGG